MRFRRFPLLFVPPATGRVFRDVVAYLLPNQPLQRTWSSLTLRTTPLNGSVVRRL